MTDRPLCYSLEVLVGEVYQPITYVRVESNGTTVPYAFTTLEEAVDELNRAPLSVRIVPVYSRMGSFDEETEPGGNG